MEINNNDKNKDIKKENNINNDSIINLLIEIQFIKILPTYIIQDICHSISTQKYKKNEYVIKQGEPISNIYIVKSGTFISLINHLSTSNISHDINSFIQYQNITNEPFLEERKYELKGQITNNEQISLFIYQKKNFFGDIELISGKNRSCFSIRANEDDSVLCYIDRNKWVKLTKRIRIPFTKTTIDKMNRINDRMVDILKRKNKNDIDKVKLCNDKINYQIEVNDNYDFCVRKIEQKEEKLEQEIEKIKSKGAYSKLNLKEKTRSLKKLQYNKKNILNLFKYPNILKDETKINLNKYLYNRNNNRELRIFKLNKTKSFFNLSQEDNKNNIQSYSNLSLLYNNSKNKYIKNSEFLKFKSRLFLTNPLNKLRNNSMIDILNSNSKSKIKFNSSVEFLNSGDPSRNINKYNSALKNTYANMNIEEYNKFKNFSNLIIKNIFDKNNNNNKVNNSTNNQEIKEYMLKMQPFNNNNNKNILNNSNKSSNNSMYVGNKKEKMDLEKINIMLKERYNLSRTNLIEKLLGKKENKSNSIVNH